MHRGTVPPIDVGLPWGRRINVVRCAPQIGAVRRGQITFEVHDDQGDRIGKSLYKWTSSDLARVANPAAAAALLRTAWSNRGTKMTVRSKVEALGFNANATAQVEGAVLRTAPQPAHLLNIDPDGDHWVEDLFGDGKATLVQIAPDEPEWTPAVRKAAAKEAARQQAQREEAARICREAVQQGKPFAHLSSFARFEDFLPQVRAREQREEAKKEIVAKRKKRSRAEPAHLVLHTSHTQHTQHTNRPKPRRVAVPTR